MFVMSIDDVIQRTFNTANSQQQVDFQRDLHDFFSKIIRHQLSFFLKLIYVKRNVNTLKSLCFNQPPISIFLQFGGFISLFYFLALKELQDTKDKNYLNYCKLVELQPDISWRSLRYTQFLILITYLARSTLVLNNPFIIKSEKYLATTVAKLKSLQQGIKQLCIIFFPFWIMKQINSYVIQKNIYLEEQQFLSYVMQVLLHIKFIS